MASKRTTERVPPQNPDSAWESTLHVFDRARGGDMGAARELIERAVPSLRRFTRGRIPSYGRGSADTEDVVQDAVVRVLLQLDSFQHRSVTALQAYLKLTVVNSIRDVIRRVRRRGVPLEPSEDLAVDAPSPLELAIRRETAARFVSALERLKPTDRQAIIWRVELGYSYEEIARQMGKSSPAAARMTVARAMKRLAQELHLGPTSA